jgi:arginine-tRNA-protein transferase
MRFSINQIRQHSSHQKLKKRNNQFSVVVGPHESISVAEATLYRAYRESIDFDGYPTLQDALLDRAEIGTIYNSQSIAVYDGEKLIAFGIFDLGEKSASSQIHCYDPAYASYSLGKYLILLTLDQMKSLGYDWYYPGYIFAGNPKMNYKLFAGKEAAEYFDPETGEWQAFVEELLEDEPYSEELILQVSEKMFGRT